MSQMSEISMKFSRWQFDKLTIRPTIPLTKKYLKRKDDFFLMLYFGKAALFEQDQSRHPNHA